MVSEEELRRTVLQPEGEEPADGFRQPDLLGKTTCLLVLSLFLFTDLSLHVTSILCYSLVLSGLEL